MLKCSKTATLAKPLYGNNQELKMNESTIGPKSFATRTLAEDSSKLKKIEQPDPVLQHLENLHLPLTRENYLEAVYPLGLPESWSPDDEVSLPHEIRRIII